MLKDLKRIFRMSITKTYEKILPKGFNKKDKSFKSSWAKASPIELFRRYFLVWFYFVQNKSSWIKNNLKCHVEMTSLLHFFELRSAFHQWVRNNWFSSQKSRVSHDNCQNQSPMSFPQRPDLARYQSCLNVCYFKGDFSEIKLKKALISILVLPTFKHCKLLKLRSGRRFELQNIFRTYR